jgi:hypothetical protein
MAYSDFTLRLLRKRFGITATDAVDLFADVPPLPPTEFFRTLLQRHLPIVRGIGTEKVRSEMIIAPLLVELREQSGHQIAVFSGAEFGVDVAQGLAGFCDFLVSRSPTLLAVTAPALAVVEAKREDLTAGVAQCIAEMYAATLFNAQNDEPRPYLYGAVTSGTNWRFLRLDGLHAEVDLQEYFIEDVAKILGILRYMTL